MFDPPDVAMGLLPFYSHLYFFSYLIFSFLFFRFFSFSPFLSFPFFSFSLYIYLMSHISLSGVFTSRFMRMYVGMIHSLYTKVPLNIIPGVKKEQEKLEQYRAYRISKEEKIKQRRLSSSSTPPTGSPVAPTPSSSKMPPSSGSVLTTPKL